MKAYVNYITQVLAHPTTRIRIDSSAGDFSKIYVSNVTTQLGYLQFYTDMSLYKLESASEYTREITEQAGYWRIAINPTLANMAIGNTYEIPCQLVDKSTLKVVQEFTIYYTRTI